MPINDDLHQIEEENKHRLKSKKQKSKKAKEGINYEKCKYEVGVNRVHLKIRK